MPTANQMQYYMSMRCSSEFNADEVQSWDSLLEATPAPSHEQVNDLLGYMRERLKAADKRKADALTRKAQYRTWADKQKGK